MSDVTPQWVKMSAFEATARLNELERENAALREDKERLDWLEKNKFQHRDFNTGDSLGYEWCVSSSYEDEICVRAAIDAARKEAQP